MDKEMKQLMDEIDGYIDSGIAKVDQQAALIRELVGALEIATQYVEATHKSIAPLVGAGSVVLPDLSRCQLALSRVPEEYRK